MADLSLLSQRMTSVVMYPVPPTFQEVILLVFDREQRRPSSAIDRLDSVIVIGRFR